MRGRVEVWPIHPILFFYMVSVKHYSSAFAPVYYRCRPWLAASRRSASPTPSIAMVDTRTVALWAQATAIQSVKGFIPVTLDLKASNFTKWRNMVNIAIRTYTINDHLTTAVLTWSLSSMVRFISFMSMFRVL
jgi:hypothetical protein